MFGGMVVVHNPSIVQAFPRAQRIDPVPAVAHHQHRGGLLHPPPFPFPRNHPPPSRPPPPFPPCFSRVSPRPPPIPITNNAGALAGDAGRHPRSYAPTSPSRSHTTTRPMASDQR